MENQDGRKNISIILIWVVFAAILLGRLHLSVIRFFDPDEFAHIHWSFLIAKGSLPYKDFFLIIPPVFHFFLLPVFLLKESTITLISARIYIFFLYLANILILFQIFKSVTKNVLSSLLAVTIFAAFPMTLDKTIDIRPDMLMTLFFLICLYLSFIRKASPFVVGFFYGLSFLTFSKIIFAAPALFYITYLNRKTKVLPHAFSLLYGALMPTALFFLYIIANGIFTEGIHAILKDSFLVNTGRQAFSPLLAISPWPLVYVNKGGVSWPWIVNTVLWILAVPAFFILWKRNRKFSVFLLLYFFFAIVLLYIFPIPYLQYFLPLCIFISLCTAVTIYEILRRAEVSGVKASSFIIIVPFLASLLISFLHQYQVRAQKESSNSEQLQVIRDILKISAPEETFFDSVGSYVLRPDGYPVCCHPFGEFIYRMENPPLPLTEMLKNRQTKFIVLDRTGLAFWKTPEPHLSFILTHYYPSKYKKIYTLGSAFSCNDGQCKQLNLHNSFASDNSISVFDIIIPEKYSVATEPHDETVLINGRYLKDGDKLFLKEGSYSFSPSQNLKLFQIQLDR